MASSEFIELLPTKYNLYLYININHRKTIFLAGTTLPRWMKVNKICLNPKMPHQLSLENASQLFIDIGDPKIKDDSFSLTRITKMKNLECLELRHFSIQSDIEKCREIFKTLQPNNVSKIRSIIVQEVSGSLIHLVHEYFPKISTALVYGDSGYGMRTLRDLNHVFDGLKNLQKLVIKRVWEMPEFYHSYPFHESLVS